MASLECDQSEIECSSGSSDEIVLETILCERASFYAFPERFRTLTVSDRKHGQFLLMDEG